MNNYVILALSLLLAGAIAYIPLASPPSWAEELGDRKAWLKLSVGSWLFGAIAGGAMTAMTMDEATWQVLASVGGATIVGTVLIMTGVTDFKLRKAYRYVLLRLLWCPQYLRYFSTGTRGTGLQQQSQGLSCSSPGSPISSCRKSVRQTLELSLWSHWQ